MGWWSATILGGDTPLDYLGDFASELNLSDTENGIPELYGYEFSKEILNKKENLNKLVRYADSIKDVEYRSIAYQVLGVILMGTGSKISGTLKEKIISYAKKDEWYQNKTPDRVKYIENFIDCVRTYKDGNPVLVKQEGLFETIAEKIASGKPGLVNKNIGK